jgi:hypothetical protein
MKSLSGKLSIIVLFIGLSLLINAEVWGADWKYLGVTRSRALVDVLPVYANVHFYDTASIVYLSKNIVKVWIKTFQDEREINPTFPPEIKDRSYETLNSLKMPYTNILLEINCSERRYKFLKLFVFFEKEGKEKEVPIDGLKTTLYKPGEISPGGDIDMLWKTLCQKK